MKSTNKIKADLTLFIKIQQNKYLQSKGKTEFDGDQERELVTDNILYAFKKKIVPEYLRLNNLNKEAKENWFNSIDIDYSNLDVEQDDIFDEIEISDELLKKLSDHYDEIFYFLPEGGWKLLLFAGPAFEVYGFPIERFKEIFSGTEPTNFEVDFFSWAYDFVVSLMPLVTERSKKKMKMLIEEAAAVGLEFLTEEQVMEVIPQIIEQISDTYKNDLRKK
ncbi:MAG: hypothetical protein ACK4R9_14125 [Ignavibacterium sp.]